MYDRISIKQRAKAKLSENKWLTIGITFVAGLLGADGVSFSGNFRFNSNSSFNSTNSVFTKELFSGILLPLIIIAVIIAIIRLFVGTSAILGIKTYYIKLLKGEYPDFAELFADLNTFGKLLA